MLGRRLLLLQPPPRLRHEVIRVLACHTTAHSLSASSLQKGSHSSTHNSVQSWPLHICYVLESSSHAQKHGKRVLLGHQQARKQN